MAYLTAWRMSLADRRLRDGDATVRQVAWEVGHDSEFAFARAFKRATGSAPGQYRKLTEPQLTTIDMNLEALGVAAVKDLFTIIDGAPRLGGVRRHACELVIRSSSVR